MPPEPQHRELTAFADRFGAPPEVLAQVPGRVNLIGGHLDYHEGLVLPLAINRHVSIYARARAGSSVHLYSEALQLAVEFDLEGLIPHTEHLGRYCQAAASALSVSRSQGFDALIIGDLPMGAGLSSSSALVVGFVSIMAALSGRDLAPLELAKLACQAELQFGTTGGMMDQYVIAHGRRGRALLIDCRSLTHTEIPIPQDAAVIVAHTGSSRHQASTPFSQRRQEAEAGLRVLQGRVPNLRTLRDVTPELLQEHAEAIRKADPTGTLAKRCQHVVSELTRVPLAAAALADDDLPTLGALMKVAHRSLCDDYGVGSPLIDAMFEAATTHPACYGARMTGGGFGGCTVNLVAAGSEKDFCDHLRSHYRDATGLEPTIFPVEASDGLQLMQLN